MRIAFLIDPTGVDPGWNVRVRIVNAAYPATPLVGTEWIGSGRFAVTADTLTLMSGSSKLDAWAITTDNVTGACVANQNSDWTQREWVAWYFQKDDASDLSIFESANSGQCVAATTDVQAVLVPGSFAVDDPSSTMQWREDVTGQLQCNGLRTVGPTTIELQYTLTRP